MEANDTVVGIQRGHLAEMVDLGISHWPAAVTSLVLLLAAFTIQTYLRQDPTSKLPRIGGDDVMARWTKYLGEGSWDMYREGYEKFKGRAFRIIDVQKRDKIVLPHTMLPELAKYPDGVLDRVQLASENMHLSYLMFDSSTSVFKRVLMAGLTPSLARVTPALREEVVEVLAAELPDSPDWTQTTIHEKILRIVAMSTGRLFVGPECCRHQTWIDGSTNYIAELAKAGKEIGNIPWLLRPILAPRLATTKHVRSRMNKFADILEPVIRARKKESAEQGDDYQKPDDMTQWMIESVDKIGHKEVMDMALEQATLSFSAVNSTAQYTSLAFFTLAAHPELAPILLEDVNQALEKSGGEWNSLAIQNMKKLDSFLNEIGRYEPFTAYTFLRKTLSPITLSDNTHLPKNTIIEINWYGVSKDADIYPDPDTFDPLRFYKIRTDPETAAKQGTEAANQLVHVSPTHLTWSYGRSACPGRFVAAHIIKLIFATLLLRYEVRNAEGVEGRVKNIRAVGMQATNPKNEIQIRRK